MSAVDSLPGDQRAVLQLVLGRGRSYDEIAAPAVDQPRRAFANGRWPRSTRSVPRRGSTADPRSICDYLLGQLPEDDVEPIRDRLAQSAGERAWARVVSSELAPLASGPLPEIPLEASGRAVPPSAGDLRPSRRPPVARRRAGRRVRAGPGPTAPPPRAGMRRRAGPAPAPKPEPAARQAAEQPGAARATAAGDAGSDRAARVAAGWW